jgi:acyl-CoA synthetase (AMP-forming)/AMP-acid ligase II
MSLPGNVTAFLLKGKNSSSPALLFRNRQYTYGELSGCVERVARLLIACGCSKGDRAALVAENSFFWVASYLGILRAGLVAVPLPASMAARDLESVLRITDARIVFTPGSLPALDSIAGSVRIITEAALAALPAEQATAALPAISPDDLAALMFTSGSTGQPRGVMVTHANIIANTESIVEYLELTDADRIMAVLPFHYCFGTSLLHTHLRVGGSLVIEPRFMYPESILQRMAETACTGFAGVPSHFQILLRNSSLRKKSFPALRYVQQAGGHLAPLFVHDLSAALPNTRIFIMYGQTEATARLSYLPPEYLPAKVGSIGRGMPGVSLRVLNVEGKDVRVGEVGEVVARGANIARGYWRAPEDSAATFRDGALYTGDLATVDDDGFIYVVDRAKDILKCGGKRVSCRHLEDDLLAFDELLEAAVIGTPDDVLGESAMAFVVPRSPSHDGLEQRLIAFCRKRMPPQFVPKKVLVANALPKNSSGKVLKSRLKELQIGPIQS